MTLVYGLLPRLLLTALCLWRWHSGRERLDLDLTLPGYGLLRERLQPASERLGVLDADPGLSPPGTTSALPESGSGALLVAIELDDSRPWPPSLPRGVGDAGILDSREQRQRLLEQLTRFPATPGHCLRSAPLAGPRHPGADRRTGALRRRHAHLAAAGPTGRGAGQPAPGRMAPGPSRLELEHADSSPLAWLEKGHD